jgi:hypothetical protein
MLRILFLTSVVLLTIGSCSNLNRKKIKEIVLYNTLSEDSNSEIKDLSAFYHNSYNDPEIVSLLQNAEKVPGTYIWKGSIIGVIIYESGGSAKIEISRYGGFYKMASNNKYYSFPNKGQTEKWKEFVNTFISDSHKQ